MKDVNDEKWAEIEYRGLPYKVSNKGRVIGKSGKMLKQRIDVDGYPTITAGHYLDRRTAIRVHRLVAMAFIHNPNPVDENDVNHIDFDRTNNNVENLEWCSHTDNIKHSINAGRYDLVRKGERNGRAILTENDIRKIRALHSSGEKNIMDIAKMYGRGWQTINHIVKRSTWKHVI